MLSRILVLGFYRVAMALIASALRAEVGNDAYPQACILARREFLIIATRLPYIGGLRNPRTSLLLSAAFFLAIIRALQGVRIAVNSPERLIRVLVSCAYSRIPNRLLRLYGRTYFGEAAMRRAEASALESQLLRYEGDWVFRFVPGDGKAHDWGYDFIECGILKFLRREGAESLVPSMCQLDFIASRHFGWGLARTTELASGGQMCDFRFSRRRARLSPNAA